LDEDESLALTHNHANETTKAGRVHDLGSG